MPNSRADIQSRIATLKGRAMAALHDHHPEVAAPLLEQALELHRLLRDVGGNSRIRLARPLADFDLLDGTDIEVLLDSADQSAFDADDLDPLDASGLRSQTVTTREADASCSTDADDALLPAQHDGDPTGVAVSVASHDESPAPDAAADKRPDLADAASPVIRNLFDTEFPENDTSLDLELTSKIEPELWGGEEDDLGLLPIAEDDADLSFPGPELDDIVSGLPEPEEYEEAPTAEDLQKVRTVAKLTKKERAFDVAMVAGARYGWDYDGICMLAEVFTLHWWNAARQAMIRQLDAGMTPDDLRIALVARRAWREHPEFHENRGRGRYSYPHTNLPWPTALAVARYFACLPDDDEVGAMLERLFADWHWSSGLAESYPSFYEFVRLQFGLIPQMANLEPGWSFVPREDVRPLEDDRDSLPPAEWSHGYGCYRTPPAPMLD